MRSPKLPCRMPPPTQRRNTAYLNRRILRFGQQDRELDDQALMPSPDLRLISGARSNRVSDPPILALPNWICRPTSLRRVDEGNSFLAMRSQSLLTKLICDF